MNKDSLLKQAIQNRQLITFIYDRKYRAVEPYHCGVLCKRIQLHSFQIEGESRSGGLPQWRNFKIKKIRNLRIIEESSFSLRDSYNPSNSHYSEILFSVTS